MLMMEGVSSSTGWGDGKVRGVAISESRFFLGRGELSLEGRLGVVVNGQW